MVQRAIELARRRAKFAVAGKGTAKNDPRAIALSRSNPYVAQISVGAMDVRSTKACLGAEAGRPQLGMEDREDDSVPQLRASASAATVEDPAAFERANYLRTIRSRSTPPMLTPVAAGS